MKPVLAFIGAALLATSAGAAELSLWDKLTIRNACRADMEALCNGVPRGDGRLLQCVEDHLPQFSEGCRSVIESYREQLARSP